MSKPTAPQLVNHSRRHIGVAENPLGSNKTPYGVQYGMNGVAWCAIFTSCMFEDKDALDLIFGKQAYTPTYAKRFHDKGQWGTTPKTGALVFYAWYGPTYQGRWKGICHVGIVERVNADGTIITVEGNVSNKVCRLRRTTKYVAGYAYPDYAPEEPATDPRAQWAYPGRVLSRRIPMQYGNDVRKFQEIMKLLGWAITVDGWYGSQSERICKAFQKAEKLTVDGMVGPQTWARMVEALYR